MAGQAPTLAFFESWVDPAAERILAGRPELKLLQFDTVLAPPHIGGITEEALRQMAVAAAEQWIALFAGGTPPRLINPQVWPRYSQRFEACLGVAPKPLEAVTR